MSIYDSKNKSYDADLICGNNNIHVKSVSQDSVDRYGLSWVIQAKDPVVTRPGINDFFALVVFQNYESVKFIGWLPANKAVFESTALGHSSKLAIYHNKNKDYYLNS